VPRFAIAPLGLTTEGGTKFKLKGRKCYLKKLQCRWSSKSNAAQGKCISTLHLPRSTLAPLDLATQGEAYKAKNALFQFPSADKDIFIRIPREPRRNTVIPWWKGVHKALFAESNMRKIR